ncbi:MAG: CRISPR-associated helicase Cas3' [Chloroflexota bacterium]|nr:MAG: CRISPR-associated helicase Cas3' [Chloroflexota bacterium]
MDMTTVLAKSASRGTSITLAEHTRNVLQAARTMFGTAEMPTHLSMHWMRFFGLAPDNLGPFLSNLWLAATFHDIGKANSGYQRLVRQQGEQVIRHEHLSALLLWQAPLQDWLRAHEPKGVDYEVVISAVVSHHLKANDETFAQPLVDSERAAVRVLALTSDIAAVLCEAARVLSDPVPDVACLDGLWGFSDRLYTAREAFLGAMHRFKRSIERDGNRQRLLLSVKAALICADSAGSAVLRMGRGLDEWLAMAFDQPLLTPADVDNLIIAPRVQQLERAGSWGGFHDFQLAVAELGSRALLLSGCGTGKTLAAWKWVQAQLKTHEARRLVFLYPTRATATEGFRDYVAWAGPEAAALSHGTSQYDLVGMFDSPEDRRFGGDYTVQDRLFALGYWHRCAFSATVDTFMAFMSNSYASICMLPVLAESVVVIDEAHSFDRAMFRALERFLGFFDVPVLCMTASMPANRLTVLHEHSGLEVFPRDSQRFADLERQSSAPRYRVYQCNESEAYGHAQHAVEAGERVLWVVNTVARSQDITHKLKEKLGKRTAVYCYHSRFRLQDRRQRHVEAISAFRSAAGPCILVCTQVCEMSLDLDADVLITETAPVTALIQRMGRCCRQPLPTDGRIGIVYCYQPADAKPYTKDQLDEGDGFVRELGTKSAVTQANLASYLEQMPDSDTILVGGFAGFLDSSWYAMAREDAFREGDDYTVDCVLDSDLDAYLAARAQSSSLATGFIVPVPSRFSRAEGRLGTFPRVAPMARYDEQLGFLTAEV